MEYFVAVSLYFYVLRKNVFLWKFTMLSSGNSMAKFELLIRLLCPLNFKNVEICVELCKENCRFADLLEQKKYYFVQKENKYHFLYT